MVLQMNHARFHLGMDLYMKKVDLLPSVKKAEAVFVLQIDIEVVVSRKQTKRGKIDRNGKLLSAQPKGSASGKRRRAVDLQRVEGDGEE